MARGSQRKVQAIKVPPLVPHSTASCFRKFAVAPSACKLIRDPGSAVPLIFQ